MKIDGDRNCLGVVVGIAQGKLSWAKLSMGDHEGENCMGVGRSFSVVILLSVSGIVIMMGQKCFFKVTSRASMWLERF